MTEISKADLIALLERIRAAGVSGLDFSDREQGNEETILLAGYLQEHGLINGIFANMFGGAKVPVHATITAKGRDYLAPDGGLTAELGVVTVKLHADTVRALIASRIGESDLPAPERKRLLDHLKDVPAETLSKVATHFLEQGLIRLPDAIPLLTKLLGL